jgi:spore germination protein YaaH
VLTGQLDAVPPTTEARAEGSLRIYQWQVHQSMPLVPEPGGVSFREYFPSVMWGNDDSIHRILSDTKKRIALEDEIAALVVKNNFDGIDIDFEAKKHETLNYFSTFLKGLYQRMGKKWVYCTNESRTPLDQRYSPGAKVPADADDVANDFVEIAKYCDRVEIMAYDQGTVSVRL